MFYRVMLDLHLKVMKIYNTLLLKIFNFEIKDNEVFVILVSMEIQKNIKVIVVLLSLDLNELGEEKVHHYHLKNEEDNEEAIGMVVIAQNIV